MINKSFERISKEDIENLVSDRISENRTLDYKQALPDKSWQSEIEFLQDICAFANASGGDIVYGIREEEVDGKKTGFPKEFVRLKIDSIDETKRRLNERIHTGIEPPIRVRINHIDGLANGAVFIVRVPPSWVAPHMVTLYRKDLLKPQFYVRHNVENLPMDIQEIRAAFAVSENRLDRLRRFIEERISLIKTGDESIPQVAPLAPMVILHLIPINASTTTGTVNLKRLQGRSWRSQGFPNPGGRSIDCRFNYHGYELVSYVPIKNKIIQYVQIFRTGAFEVVYTSDTGVHSDFEVVVLRRVKDYLLLQAEMEVQLPILVAISLFGTKGHTVISNIIPREQAPRNFDRDFMTLPDSIIDDFDTNLPTVFRSAFDAYYQAAAVEGCPSYDAEGAWIGTNL